MMERYVEPLRALMWSLSKVSEIEEKFTYDHDAIWYPFTPIDNSSSLPCEIFTEFIATINLTYLEL